MSNIDKKRSDWPLIMSKKNITHFPSTGIEQDNLRKTIDSSNGVNGVIASLKFIYNHVVDANKPDFEVWCKSIRTEDIESLYFGHYYACYSDTNIMQVECPHEDCKKASFVEIPINQVWKFDNEDDENMFNEVRRQSTVSPKETLIDATLMQVSDNYAISFVPASLYSTFIQYATIKPELMEKYSDILNTMAYVDKIFKINKEDKTLQPVKIQEYRNNINKTVLAKLKVYAGMLKTLTSDQYNILIGKLNNIIEDPKIKYVRPKCNCPVCGKEIPEENVDSILGLLFTRALSVQAKNL